MLESVTLTRCCFHASVGSLLPGNDRLRPFITVVEVEKAPSLFGEGIGGDGKVVCTVLVRALFAAMQSLLLKKWHAS